MEKITINTPGFSSEILVGEHWDALSRFLPERGTAIITDDNVKQVYGGRFPKVPVFSLSAGEGSKKLEVIEYLAAQLLEAGIDR